MFYFIPVKINHRRYFVAQLKHNNTHFHHFIIRKGQPDVFSLFNAGTEWKHLYSNCGPDKDVVLQFRAHATANTLVIELLDKRRVEQVTAVQPPPVEKKNEEAKPATDDDDEDNLNSMIRSIFGRKSSSGSALSSASSGSAAQTILQRESLDELSAAARKMGFDFAHDYLLRNKTYPEKQLNVVLQYTDEDSSVYRANLCFHFQQEDHPVMYHMLDFGSEASQIARCYPDRDMSPAMQYNIVEEMEKLSGMQQPGVKDINRRYYLQDELGSMGRQQYLYSSKIFIRKKNAIFSETDKKILFHNNVNDTNVNEPGHSLMNTLTDSSNNTQIRYHYTILPNLKILSFMPQMVGNMEFADIDVEQQNAEGESSWKHFEETNFYSQHFNQKIYNAILNSFLYLIVNKIKRYNEHGLLDLNILVPNIYGQHKVTELYKSIETDLPIIIQKEGLQDVITGFEIHIISESDASFLGMMSERFFHEQAAKTDEKFLVVDSGKGTTDFSIIRKNAHNRYDSIYRSGIPGAGNVITYAFLETITHAVTNAREKIHIIRRIMAENTTLSERLSISEALEEIKRNYSNRQQLTAADIKTMVQEVTGQDSLDYENPNCINNLVGILQKISRTGTISDMYGYINLSVQYLVNEVMKCMTEIDRKKEMRFNRVFLSGRAFLFAPFKEYMVKRLVEEQYLSGPEGVQVPGNMKDVCIKGSVKGDQVNFDSGIIGLPLLSAYFNINAGTEKKTEPKRWYQNLYSWVSGGGGSGDLSSHVAINDHFFYKHPDHNINLKHFGLDDTNRVLRFKIGRYSYMADFSGNDIFEWNLLFNGEEMVFKDMTANRYTVPLVRINLDDADRDTCYKSLMPYISNHEIDPPVTPYTEPETPVKPANTTPVTEQATTGSATTATENLPFNIPATGGTNNPPVNDKDKDINELYNFL